MRAQTSTGPQGRPKRQTYLIAVGPIFLRILLACELLSLPLAVFHWMGWWTVPPNMNSLVAIWLFFNIPAAFVLFGFGVLLVTPIPFILLYLWASLVLGCLGVRPALKHFNEMCHHIGEFLTNLGELFRSANVTFTSDEKEQSKEWSEAMKEVRRRVDEMKADHS